LQISSFEEVLESLAVCIDWKSFLQKFDSNWIFFFKTPDFFSGNQTTKNPLEYEKPRTAKHPNKRSAKYRLFVV
jgi:hypothetical protein